MTTAAGVRTWDEPAGAASPRGWLRVGPMCVGFYLDYGPDHYRSPHVYCRPDKPCRECQPGNVLAVRYPDGPGLDGPRESRFFETVDAARSWVETGAATTAEYDTGYREQAAWLRREDLSLAGAVQCLGSREATLDSGDDFNRGGNDATAEYVTRTREQLAASAE